MNNSNLVIFVAELVGTFGLLIAATGCIVYDGMLDGAYGIAFIAIIADRFANLTSKRIGDRLGI